MGKFLPTLEKLHTANSCEKPCNPDKHLCQYGLDKAVRFCKSPTLIAAPLQWYLGLKQ
jgi:hypothetical protein